MVGDTDMKLDSMYVQSWDQMQVHFKDGCDTSTST